jgi:hypothetical protein
MHDSVEVAVIEDRFKFCAVGDITLDKLGAAGNQISPGVAKIVVNDDLMAFIQQRIRNGSANVTGASSDQDSQSHAPSSGWKSR